VNRTTLATLGLLVAISLAACTPSVAPPTPTPTDAVVEAPTSSSAAEESPTEAEPTPVPTEVVEATEPPTEQPPTEEPKAVATSRGDFLVATDPATVNLASGEPQLIEFFAYW